MNHWQCGVSRSAVAWRRARRFRRGFLQIGSNSKHQEYVVAMLSDYIAKTRHLLARLGLMSFRFQT